jgi:phosphoglycolate phosphatase
MNHPPPKLLVFDWDGTLVDSTRAIVIAMQNAAADLALPVPSSQQASHVIGLGLHEALQIAVPTLSRHQLPAYIERYRFHYLSRDAQLGAFEGIESMLDALEQAGVAMAVATGKSRQGLDRALVQFDWRRRFVATRCADEGEPKPHPWMLEDLALELGLSTAQMVMVGDTTHDLGMARAAGASAVGVTYGAHERHDLLREPSLALVDDVPGLRHTLFAQFGLRDPGPAAVPAQP